MSDDQRMEPSTVVVAYDPAWPMLFQALRRQVEPAVRDVGARVEHVGSTTVSGLAAKPIIDLDVVVPTVSHVAPTIERLVGIGYTHEGDLGVPDREGFSPPPSGPYHHLYVVVEGSRAHRDHLDLRDYLCCHPDDAHRYGARKYELVSLLETDRAAYLSAKGDLVEELLRRARRGTTE